MSHPSEAVRWFRELARLYSREVRARDNARSTMGGVEMSEKAFAKMQSIEVEFETCFAMRQTPNLANVEARAKGEIR
jgi:hypothetical protein